MNQSLPNGYYYHNEAEQFTFYRVPKLLFTDTRFKDLTDSAKLLYGLMLDRMGLSKKNGWLDSIGRVYIYFTMEDICSLMSCKNDKALKLLNELDTEKGVGLIERKKQGQGKPTIIYIRKFTQSTEVLTSEKPKSENKSMEKNDGERLSFTPKNEEIEEKLPKNKGNIAQDTEKVDSPQVSKIQTSEKPKSRVRKNRSLDFGKTGSLDFGKTDTNNTEKNKTEFNKTNPSFLFADSLSHLGHTKQGEEKRMDERKYYENLIKENIEYDILRKRLNQEQLDEILMIMLDVICSKAKVITVKGAPCPQQEIADRLLTLNSSHIEYVFECLDKNTSAVRNPYQYLLAILFNATASMGNHYQMQVNHDMNRM